MCVRKVKFIGMLTWLHYIAFYDKAQHFFRNFPRFFYSRLRIVKTVSVVCDETVGFRLLSLKTVTTL